MYGSNCKEAEREGVSVLHGNRGVYHDDKQPTFRALYEAIRDVSVLVKADTCLPAFGASLWSTGAVKANHSQGELLCLLSSYGVRVQDKENVTKVRSFYLV